MNKSHSCLTHAYAPLNAVMETHAITAKEKFVYII